MRSVALAPVLASALASAATITIDDFTTSAYLSATANNGVGYTGFDTDSVANNATRDIWGSVIGTGSSELTVGGGLASKVANTWSDFQMNYNFNTPFSLLPAGASAADITISFWASNNSLGATEIRLGFGNGPLEMNTQWDFTLAPGASGLQSIRLIDIDPNFTWDMITTMFLYSNSMEGGTLTFGGDGQGLRAAAVPEPSTYGLMAGALALAAVAARRRRR